MEPTLKNDFSQTERVIVSFFACREPFFFGPFLVLLRTNLFNCVKRRSFEAMLDMHTEFVSVGPLCPIFSSWPRPKST